MHIEALEARELLAATITADLSGSLLRIEGTAGSDPIHILQSGDQISIQGVAIQSGGGTVGSISASLVDRIVVDSLGDNDHVWVGDGSTPLTPVLQVLGTQGGDLLHTRDTTFATRLEDGVAKVLQVEGRVYSLGHHGTVLKNGVKQSFGGFALQSVQLAGGNTELLIEGDATVPVVDQVHFVGFMSSSGEYFLKAES